MKKRQACRLYNVIFPIWLLWIFPLTWLMILPANFIIDSAVVLIALKLLKVPSLKSVYKKVILKVWGFGFLADIIGTVFMFLALILEDTGLLGEGMKDWWYTYITNAVSYNPFENIWAFLWVTACVIVSCVCIYCLNYKISFKKLTLEQPIKKKLALALAIFTAPILFYLPTSWFY